MKWSNTCSQTCDKRHPETTGEAGYKTTQNRRKAL